MKNVDIDNAFNFRMWHDAQRARKIYLRNPYIGDLVNNAGFKFTMDMRNARGTVKFFLELYNRRHSETITVDDYLKQNFMEEYK